MTQENEQRTDSLPAPEVFSQAVAGLVNQHDVGCMIEAQKLMMQRYEKTNEMLINCNGLSASRFHSAAQDIRKHTQLLWEMKKDLESVFKRIRNLKVKLGAQYPHAFEVCSGVSTMDDEELEAAASDIANKLPLPASGINTERPALKAVIQLTNSSSCSQTTTPSPATSPTSSESA